MGSAPYCSKMQSNTVRRIGASIALALVAASALFASAVIAGSDELVRAPSGVVYVTGGAGTEAVDRLKSMEKDFNLKLVFATTAGAYLSDVQVTIVDATGRVMLNATSEGPLLMAKLPAASYQIVARLGEVSESRKVHVAAEKLVVVDYRWPAK